MLDRNETALDRALRIVLGTFLLALVFVGPRTAWGWIGIIPLVTGVAGYCPLYSLIGAKPRGDHGGGCCS
ncbi:MAG TPA: DUF2892 domain-containing protein [Kofleriaceae bacterium]|jgi:hypothetical protein|nr:DUF2892 domain-containing protein [Kofleriaceae bacterium]